MPCIAGWPLFSSWLEPVGHRQVRLVRFGIVELWQVNGSVSRDFRDC